MGACEHRNTAAIVSVPRELALHWLPRDSHCSGRLPERGQGEGSVGLAAEPALKHRTDTWAAPLCSLKSALQAEARAGRQTSGVHVTNARRSERAMEV